MIAHAAAPAITAPLAAYEVIAFFFLFHLFIQQLRFPLYVCLFDFYIFLSALFTLRIKQANSKKDEKLGYM